MENNNLSEEDYIYLIALQSVFGVGNITAKTLISYCGSPKNVMTSKPQKLIKIPGIGQKTIEAFKEKGLIEAAEKEYQKTIKSDIELVYYLSEKYPNRLVQNQDCPILLYKKGKVELENTKVLSIVGTRNSTEYGKDCTQKIISELSKKFPITIVSGLAYGIDAIAHKSALDNNINNIAVLAHGLKYVQPSGNVALSKKMMDKPEKNALITEYPFSTKADSTKFPARNRIIAGLCDAVLVVESGIKGGALITADIAFSYNRDVLAIPGRVGDSFSSGCNKLIKSNKAALVETADDICNALNWDTDNLVPKQTKLFLEPENLSFSDKIIFDFLKEHNKAHVDEIQFKTNFSNTDLAMTLLDLEFRNIIQALPGKFYKLS
jgi:DNA processing protein